MRVELVTVQRGTSNTSLSIYARKIQRALEIDRQRREGHDQVYLVETDNGSGGRRGGVLRPLIYRTLHSFPRPPNAEPNGLIRHATEPSSALKGVDVVTIHDLYAFEVPGLMMQVFRHELRSAAKWARRIVVESEMIRNHVRHHLGARAYGICRVIPPPFPTVPLQDTPKEFDLLWVGSLERRKNPVGFLDELADYTGLPAESSLRVAFFCHPVGFGDEQLLREAVDRAGKRHRVTWFSGNLTDDELDSLYRKSKVFVSTSTLEGYHAPVMEAYSRGVRVLLPTTLPLYHELYDRRAGVDFYNPARGFIGELAKNIDAGPFVPDPELLAAVSYETVGRKMWDVYRELCPGR